MSIRFIFGEDEKFFDYSKIDNNSDYDEDRLISEDEAEDYFDKVDDLDPKDIHSNEKEENNMNVESTYTGIQDY
jgi:hypothetical protein